MTEDFSEDILFRVVAQICQMVGFQSVLSSPLYILTDILRQLILYLGKRARSYSELCGRTDVELSDLSRTFYDMRIYPSELVEFFQTVGPLPLPISVPRYPVAFNRSDQHIAGECNTVECVDFTSEGHTGYSATGRLCPPQNNGLDFSNYIVELNETTDFNQCSLQEHNGADRLKRNSAEARESLKVIISLTDVKKEDKTKKIKKHKMKKVSKKQKKDANKCKHKKNKKNKKRKKHLARKEEEKPEKITLEK